MFFNVFYKSEKHVFYVFYLQINVFIIYDHKIYGTHWFPIAGKHLRHVELNTLYKIIEIH